VSRKEGLGGGGRGDKSDAPSEPKRIEPGRRNGAPIRLEVRKQKERNKMDVGKGPSSRGKCWFLKEKAQRRKLNGRRPRVKGLGGTLWKKGCEEKMLRNGRGRSAMGHRKQKKDNPSVYKRNISGKRFSLDWICRILSSTKEQFEPRTVRVGEKRT